MANAEQLSILKQGVQVWNKWRDDNSGIGVDLTGANLIGADLAGAHLWQTDLRATNLSQVNLTRADLSRADLKKADLGGCNLSFALLNRADLTQANLSGSLLNYADLAGARVKGTNLSEGNFSKAVVGATDFGNSDLSNIVELERVVHTGPSSISVDTFALSKGKIPAAFLRGCGLSDWEIEEVKLYNPDLTNDDINTVLYRMYDLRSTQALQISPLFVSYSHADSEFVDKVGNSLTEIGVRYWRDIHDMKAGRLETQIDRGIRQNPTVLLVLSENSLKSDWVEHEVRIARNLERELERDTLCPVALDDSWKSSRWPKRIMEQIMEYNILDFSEWEDDVKFEGMFRKLIDGLELFYKG